MLRTTLLRFATTAVAIGIIGCGGDGGGDSTGPGGGNGQFRFTAKIDGANWASNAGVETVGVPVSLPGLFASPPRRSGRFPTTWGTRYRRRSTRSEEHTSELQSQSNLVCRLL